MSYVNFLNRLQKNPSQSIKSRLFDFMEGGGIPVDEDGYLIAYKKVRKDYKDIHTGKMDNSVGKVVAMPRTEVVENQNITCAAGLHFCSFSYLGQYSSDPTNRIVIVKVDPQDVVSVPTDYNNTKVRCSRYEVIGEITDHSKDVLKDKMVIDKKAVKRSKEVVSKVSKVKLDKVLTSISNAMLVAVYNNLVQGVLKQMVKAKVERKLSVISKFSSKQAAINALYKVFAHNDIERVLKEFKYM